MHTVQGTLDTQKKEEIDILLVDDDSYNLELASMLLAEDGHRVTVADNGQTALEKLSGHDFQAVFLDMEMPILNGLETAEIIRSCEAGDLFPEQRPHLPIASLLNRYKGKHILLVAMTGNDDETARNQCKNAGMDGFLAKPYFLAGFRKVLQCPGYGLNEPESMLPSSFKGGQDRGEELFQAAMGHMKNIYPLEDEQVHQLLQESVKSIQQAMVEIRNGMADLDLTTVAASSHRMKGILMAMGLDEQMELARALEISAKKQEQHESKKFAEGLAESVFPFIEKGNS